MAGNRRRRDGSGHVDPFFRRRRRFEGVLQVLSIADVFGRMDRRMQEQFLALKYPDPIVEFDAGIGEAQMPLAQRKEIERNFAEAMIEFNGGVISVGDFFSILASLLVVVRDSIKNPGAPASCLQFMQQALPVLKNAYDGGLPKVWNSLHCDVITPLVARSRLDTRIFFARVLEELTEKRKPQLRLKISASEPQTRRVELDGSQRPMVRVGTGNGWYGVEWISWDCEIFGSAAVDGKMPVYIQSHGLKQLHARVNMPSAKPYLEYWLYESLRSPRIVERQGGDWLVEYRIHEDRMGYLIVTPARDCVAIRTFLFLTMEGTPEARSLRQKLRLGRREKDWLGLSELSAFTQTDLREDAELRAIFEECGCGHLFELAEQNEGAFTPDAKPLAAEMRKFLRMAA